MQKLFIYSWAKSDDISSAIIPSYLSIFPQKKPEIAVWQLEGNILGLDEQPLWTYWQKGISGFLCFGHIVLCLWWIAQQSWVEMFHIHVDFGRKLRQLLRGFEHTHRSGSIWYIQIQSIESQPVNLHELQGYYSHISFPCAGIPTLLNDIIS